jgi:PucR C-terminal helix-turn-helix domain/GGDEF-like domain
MERLATPPARSWTIRTIVESLGQAVLQPIAAPCGLDVRAGPLVVQDEADELTPVLHGILVLIAARPTSLAALDAIRTAAQAGYSATVIKLHGHSADTLIQAAEESRIAVLVAADHVPWQRLVALLSASLSLTDPGGDLARSAGDMFSLANAIAGAVGGAVAVEDVSQNVVAYSTVPDQEIDEIRQKGILARHIPELPKHVEQYRTLYRTEGVVHYPLDPDTGELPRAAVAVRAGTEVVGSIWVVEGSVALNAEADRVLSDASRITALYFLRARAAEDIERQAKSELLTSLVQGDGSPAAIAGELGIHRDDPFVILGFDFLEAPGKSKPLSPRLAHEVARYAATFGVDLPVATLGSVVYAILSSVTSSESAVRVANAAVEQAESALHHSVRGAISTPSTDPAEAPGLRREVDEVLRVLTSNSSAPSIASAEQVHNQVLLARLSDSLRHEARLGHAAVRALAEYDRARGTAYGASLLAYFEAMGDISSAARELKVHGNTLRYRIRRASSLFDLDLADPDDRLLVWLQLRLALGAEGPGGASTRSTS